MILASTCIILDYFIVLYWLRIFEKTSFYVTLTFKAISDSAIFLGLLCIILIAFGFANEILDHHQDKTDSISSS